MLACQAMNQINHTTAALVVHGIGDVAAAVEAARALDAPLTLISAPGAAAYAGAPWFLALVDQARELAPGLAVTGILDCAEDPGHAMAALRAGAAAIVFTGEAAVAEKLSALAAESGSAVLRERPDSCDPDVADKQSAFRRFLSAASPSACQ